MPGMSDFVSAVATAIIGARTGSQKAASVLMSLHPDQAAMVLGMFSPSEVAEITAEMMRLCEAGWAPVSSPAAMR
ncbi:hypothetical protein [Arthrobacter sp. CAN_C5]|uniref:hypothetical protein n=1 Tax=Arthrobacter sp. CAN_C5 TaxID=2760706 RepID=UPI0037C174D1